MATILQMMFPKCIFFNEKKYIFIQISLKFAPKGSTDDE